MNMATYERYIDSGTKWLGEIPEHWSTYKLNDIASIRSEINEPTYELLSVYLDKGVIPFSAVADKRTNATSNDLSKYQVVHKGDFVLNNQQAWRGSVGVSDHKGIISPAYIILKFNNDIDSSFANYMLRDSYMVSQYLISSKGVGTIQRNLYWQYLKSVKILLPPFSEQKAIANFLDEKCVTIDRAIGQKEQLIKFLIERKQILIQNAVTKGLNPEVKLVDSGVEWIGKIPEHWGVKRLRYLGQTQNGISEGAEYFGTGFPFISYGDVYKNRVLPKVGSGLAQSTISDREKYSIKEGDVFFTRTSETIDEIGYSSVCFTTIENGTFSGFIIRFRPNTNDLCKEFSRFYFSAVMHREYFTKEMNMVTRASLSQELLKDLPVLLPSKEEQRIIASRLSDYESQINNAISIEKSQIEKLIEFKSTLINSAVTGKIKVN